MLCGVVSGLSPFETAWGRKAVVDQDGTTAEVMEREERSEEHTSELKSPTLISYAVFCLILYLKKKKKRSIIIRGVNVGYAVT